MRKQFVFNILFLILVNILIKPFWIFGIDAQVQNTLGNEIYGSYYTLLNLALIFQIILDLGIQNYSNKSIATSHHTFKNLFPNIFITKTGLSFFYIIILFCTSICLGYSKSQIQFLLFICIIPILQSFYLLFRSIIAAFQKFKTDSILSILDRSILILLCGSILYLPIARQQYAFNVKTYVFLQIISLSIANIIAFTIIKHNNTIHWSLFNYKKSISIIKSSLPFAFLILLMGIYMRIDSVILERYLGSEIAGIHSAIFRILDVCNNMSGVLIGGMLLSFFSKHINNQQIITSICRLCNIIFLPIAILGTIIIAVYNQEILHLIYSNYPQASIPYLAILILAYPMYSLIYIYSTLLTANNNIKLLTKISLIATIFALFSNIILIPIGALKANLILHVITISFVGITCLVNSIIKFGKNIFTYKDLVKLVLIVISNVAIVLSIKCSSINLFIQISLSIAIGLFCIAIFNIKTISTHLKQVPLFKF